MKRDLFWKTGGFAALVLLPAYASLISSQSDERFHTPFPLTSVAVGLLLNLFLAALLCTVAALWLRRCHCDDWMLSALPGAMLLLTLPLFLCWRANPVFLPAWFWISLMAGITAAMFWLRSRHRSIGQGVLKLCAAVLTGFGFFSLFVVFQLVRLAIWRPAPTQVSTSLVQRASSDHHPRIVWILLDELSYDQIYGHRAKDLALPNIDRFRQSSTLFTDAQPTGQYTEEVLPSLLIGHVIQRVEYTYANKTLVALPGKGFEPLHSSQTIFATARRNGYTTGVVGWYNPYCGMLAPYLNDCFWTRTSVEDDIVTYRAGVLANLARPWVLYARRLHDAFSTHPRWDVPNLANREPEYRQLMAHSLALAADSQPDFMLFHLPVPHPPGFYNRETSQFDTSGNRSYLDNLVLADKSLGEILSALRSTPNWEQTSVIVCGDHSWRTWRWRTRLDWSREDRIASRGIFDPRPMLMVHLAGQTTPATVSSPFPLIHVHEILDSLIENKPLDFTAETAHP